jgi:RNA polymerase sigma-70 factor (ECF subfamily)
LVAARCRGSRSTRIRAILLSLVHLAAVSSEQQEMPRSGTAPRLTAAEEAGLRVAIVGEIPRLRRYAASLLYNRSDADDLIQDCLETALTKLASLKDPARLRPWMLAILHNLFLMRLRSGTQRYVDGSLEQFANDLAAAAPPEDRTGALDLARAMGKLSFEHRQILLLINLEGYKYQDVAEILAIPPGTVMSRLARARERLRAALEGYELPVAED